jgi:hypothetical protein
MSGRTTGDTVHEADVLETLRVRLIDPPTTAINDLERRLPAAPAGAGALPVLEVRFVERLSVGDPLRPIGRAGHADDGDGLVVGRGAQLEEPRFRIRFDALPPASRVDGSSVMVCERSLGRVPHLVPLVNIALLGLGVLPLHASAVEIDGAGIALAGWRKSGKTEGMLALLGGGDGLRRLIADEWAYVHRDGRVAGLPGPVRLPVAVIAQAGLPSAVTGPAVRARLARVGADAAGRLQGPAPGALGRLTRQAATWLDALAAVDVPASRLAGPAGVAAGASLRLLVLLRPLSHGAPRVEPVTVTEVVGRMTAAHVHHRLDMLDLYWTARFASPTTVHPVLDDLARHEADALAVMLEHVRCVVLQHPLPADVAGMRGAIERELASILPTLSPGSERHG